MVKRVQLVTLIGVLCTFASVLPGDAQAQTQIKPRFVIILDTSGSMLQTPQQVPLGTTLFFNGATPTTIACSNPGAACTQGAACSFANQTGCTGGQRCGPNGRCSTCVLGADCNSNGQCGCPAEFGEQVCCTAGTAGCPATDNLCHIVDGVATRGDGSMEQPGCDLNGDGQFNDSKLYQGKTALSNVISAYGEAEYALERYNEIPGGGTCTNNTAQPSCDVFCGQGGDPACSAGTTCTHIAGTPAGCNRNTTGGQCVCTCNAGTGTCGADFRCNSCPTGPDGANLFACVNLGAGNVCMNCPVNFATNGAVDLTNGYQDVCLPTSYAECKASTGLCGSCDLNSGFRNICTEELGNRTCNGAVSPLNGTSTVACAAGTGTDPNMCISSVGVYGNATQQCVNGTGDVVVGFPSASFDNYSQLISWINNTESDGVEFRANGATPLAGSLSSAESFLSTPQVFGSDPAISCRSYNVILITDGIETCNGNPATAAAALRTTPIPGSAQTKDVKTFVIGFALCPPSDPNCSAGQTLNAIAASGGTGNAFPVTDAVTLQATLANIIQNSIPREICNGDDDNCDGQCDENFPQVQVNPTSPTGKTCSNPHSAQSCTVGIGACQRTGIFKCNGPNGVACCVNDGGGSTSPCTPLTPGAPGTETCPHNGIDDDCNGVVDDNSCPTPTPEVCNNADDDLDGTVDEWSELFPCQQATGPFSPNCMCITGTTVTASCPASGPLPINCGCLPTCGSSVGQCRPGLQECINGVLSCVGATGPATEICDGLDNNCNGVIDDVPPSACYDGASGCVPNGSGGFTCTGVCRAGSRTCGACNGEVTPVSEIACNGLDDNCNGQVDEPAGQPCYPAGTAGCVPNGSGGFTCTGACRTGTFQCQGGSLVCAGATTPSAEICDGIDNNCDGQVDNFQCGQAQGICTAQCQNSSGGPCTPGQPCTCNTRVGSQTETCNGQDDDCDGIIDNNLPGPFNQPCAPTGATCNLAQNTCCGICTPGTLRCIGGAPVCDGAVGPRTEQCNGLDDNCDCQVDNNVPGLGGTCGSNVGACRAGTFQCQNGTVQCVGSTGPSAEVCDNIDNDCNGVIDDNVPGAGNACYTAGPPSNCNLTANPPRCNGICRPGQQVCVNGSMQCQGQSGPRTETCNGLDDDCDGVVDNGFNVGGPCTVMFGSCPSMGTLICRADGTGTTCNAPPVSSSPEICDGIDNNCDGVADEPNQIWPCPTSAPNPSGCICPTGRSCGSTADLPFCYCPPQCGLGVGECQPGHLECTGGQQRCVGGTQPTPELCNCLDDDCNGIVDDNPMGEGDACPPTDPNRTCDSTGVGCRSDEQCDTASGNCIVTHVTAPSTCRNGHKHCTSTGTNMCGFVCEGATGPSPEICDGLDNDCDGVIDNGATCPPMYSCISGSCQPNCQISEFPCTADRRCIDPSTGSECNPPRTNCVCLPNLCANANCDPATQDCVILNGMAMCKDRCPAGHCTAPLMCDPATGMCLDCHSAQFACPTGQVCSGNPGTCVPDPCINVMCGHGEFCRDGMCISSCPNGCPQNQVCGDDGQCHDSQCDMQCMPGQVCNPETHQCQMNMCTLQCPVGEQCVPKTGQCIPDPCLTTRCNTCEICNISFAGMAVCQQDPSCVPPPTINFTGIGGGGCACDVAGHETPSGVFMLALALGIVLFRRTRGGRR